METKSAQWASSTGRRRETSNQLMGARASTYRRAACGDDGHLFNSKGPIAAPSCLRFIGKDYRELALLRLQ
eukprot:2263270-Amphidinium_carterae.2